MDRGICCRSRFKVLSFISEEKIYDCRSCDDAVGQEVTLKGIQYEDEKVSDMCGYDIQGLYGFKRTKGSGSGGVIEVKDAVCFRNGCSK